MTKDEVMNMPAGREMDELIAKIVYPDAIRFFAFPNYSTDIAAAWEVIEKLRDKLSEIVLDRDGDWRCFFIIDNVEFFAYDKSAPLAICRAALLSLLETV